MTVPADLSQQRVLGVLGGMSWASTAEYYRLLNTGVGQRLGGLHSARLVLASLDFAPLAQAQHDGDWEAVAEALGRSARGLAEAGAGAVLLATNTMHKVAGRVEETAGLPLLHIADATAAAARSVGAHRVGLLGTAFTMEDDFYTGRLAGHGLDCLVPGAADRALVHRVIYDELCHDVVTEASRAAYRRVIADLVAHGAEAVVLGCTEIGLLVGEEDAEVPVLDSTRAHCAAAVDWLVA